MYVAIELKTKVDGTLEVSTFKKETREEAEKAYHSILSGAATSIHPIHSAVILNPEGASLRHECYKHEPPKPEPQPEPEPEPEPDPEPEDQGEKEGEPEQESETVEEDSTEEQNGGEG